MTSRARTPGAAAVEAAVEMRKVSVTYPGVDEPTLDGVDLRIEEGELCLVVGATGSGKSTLLRAVSGLVPRFTGGLLSGEVLVGGRSTATHAPRELADVVGTVGQSPAAGFVADTVENELAYVMENLAVGPDVMRRRVEDTLDLLGLAELRDRPLGDLSAGQQQRVAIGSVLAANPRVLVLDEPTSALDPAAADEVLAALTRLVHDQGLTVLVAEHRLERIVQFADLVVHVPGAGRPVEVGDPRSVLGNPGVPRPPVVRLGEVASWPTVTLTVREARRLAGPLRERLGQEPAEPDGAPEHPDRDVLVEVRGMRVAHGPVPALRGVDLDLRAGEVCALMGRNGAGKSTLMGRIAGLRAPDSGTVRVDGLVPASTPARRLVRSVGLVPAEVGVLFFRESVAEECSTADADAGLAPGSTWTELERLVPTIDPTRHPRDLSEGQQLALALALILAPAPRVVCLDEPTRGLDYEAKARLVVELRRIAAEGRCVFLATHDVELVAEVADRVVLLADGEVVDDGPTRRVVCASPVFAPQVGRVLAPATWLTVEEVATGLEVIEA